MEANFLVASSLYFCTPPGVSVMEHQEARYRIAGLFRGRIRFHVFVTIRENVFYEKRP